MIGRRGFISRVAFGLLAAPGAMAEGSRSEWTVGFLSGRSGRESEPLLAAFKGGLREYGLLEDRDLLIRYRWAEGRFDRLPGLAAELIRLKPSLIVAVGGPRSVLAARQATSTIPIVFAIGGDPVRLGIVKSLARPEGNATGVSFLLDVLVAKRLELMHELVPNARVIALLVNPNTPTAQSQITAAKELADTFGIRLLVASGGSADEIDRAFGDVFRSGAEAIVFGTDAFLSERHQQLVALSARYGLPATYEGREAVVEGGLMSYGPSLPDIYRQVGNYAGRILKGARPEDLPVVQPTRFELVFNMKTARRLGLNIPVSLRVRADEAIE